jgi:hypothetical protein
MESPVSVDYFEEHKFEIEKALLTFANAMTTWQDVVWLSV